LVALALSLRSNAKERACCQLCDCYCLYLSWFCHYFFTKPITKVHERWCLLMCDDTKARAKEKKIEQPKKNIMARSCWPQRHCRTYLDETIQYPLCLSTHEGGFGFIWDRKGYLHHHYHFLPSLEKMILRQCSYS